MAVSRISKAADAAHIRRFKKLRPKARFKELSKGDQYIVTARTLAYMLDETRKAIGGPLGKITSGYRLILRSIDARYIEFDPMTDLLTRNSVRKIKRTVANAFRGALGHEALFMFTIEQQDKDGLLISPHVHALAIVPFRSGSLVDLKRRLHRVAGDDDPDTIMSKHISVWGKGPLELAPAEADFRRAALYDTKNDQSEIYRSKALLVHVHQHFERLKKHYKVSR